MVITQRVFKILCHRNSPNYSSYYFRLDYHNLTNSFLNLPYLLEVHTHISWLPDKKKRQEEKMILDDGCSSNIDMQDVSIPVLRHLPDSREQIMHLEFVLAQIRPSKMKKLKKRQKNGD